MDERYGTPGSFECARNIPGCLKANFQHIKKDHPFVIQIFLLLVVFLIGMILGSAKEASLIGTDIASTETYDKLLVTMLTIFAILISISGFGVYKTLVMKLEHAFEEYMKGKEKYIFAKLYNDLSYAFYNQYEIDKKNKSALDQALKKIKNAQIYAQELDGSNKTCERLIGQIYNNHAYYLAERGDEKDKVKAKQFVDLLETKLTTFPDVEDENWLETINFVKRKYSF